MGLDAATVFLYFFYIAYRWETEGPQMVLKIMGLQMVRDATLAAGFLIRAMTVSESSIRAFFRTMAALFLMAGAADLISLLTPYISRAGPATWTDITWCAPYLFVAVTAAPRHPREDELSQTRSYRFWTIVFSQALPIVIP